MRTIDRGRRFGTRAVTALVVRGVRARGRADAISTQPTHAIVGLTMIESMLMTPGAQANEMKRIDTDMRSFGDELAAAAAAHGDTTPQPPTHATARQILDYAKAIGAQPPASPIVALYRNAWLPLWHTWTTFYAANKDGAWWSNPVSEAEKYQDQLIDIRDQAGKLGLSLQTPGPKREHPEGLPSWLLPVGVGVGALVALSILARGNP